MKTLCIYHNSAKDFPCPDGIVSAWVVSQKFPDAEYIGLTYSERDEMSHLGFLDLVSDYKKLIIADFSLTADMYTELQHLGVSFITYDHHKSAIQAFEKLSEATRQKTYSLDSVLASYNIVFDIEECGASLTWRELFPSKKPPAFLKFIRDRDLFTKAYEITDILHMAMAKLTRNFTLFDLLAPMSEEELIAFLYPIGYPRWEARRNKIIDICTKKIKIAYNLPWITLNMGEAYLKSDLAEWYLSQAKENYPWIVIMSTNKKERIRIKSYYPGIDLLELFAELNPGGHPGTINFEVFPGWEKFVITKSIDWRLSQEQELV